MISWAEDPRLAAEVAAHPYPLLFATVSGAHLYGFPSADSDFDLRGVHLLAAHECLGLDDPEETVTLSHLRDGIEIDLVTHDARKFFKLLLRGTGYVLEQLYSPLVVATSDAHAELKEIARGCVARSCLRHYRGFAIRHWELFGKESPPRVKPLLYVYRALLSGILLLRTGEVNANLVECNEKTERLSFLGGLIQQKTSGAEREALTAIDLAFHTREVERLREVLAEAWEHSPLPDGPTCRPALNDFLLRLRKGDRP